MRAGNEMVWVISIYCSCGQFVRYEYTDRIKPN
jgi:hypothetical protein